MGKVKYPNPKFFKAKDRMDWAAQAENLKPCLLYTSDAADEL